MSTLTPMDASLTQLCTEPYCQHARSRHPHNQRCVDCRCLEFRYSPNDTAFTLAKRLAEATGRAPEDDQTWRERFRMCNVPMEVPAVRWYPDISRVLSTIGIFTEVQDAVVLQQESA
jgi:hypothetical protein